jgi:hypothetical protein
MKKYITFGNCQADILHKHLSTNTFFASIYEQIPVKPVYKLTQDEVDEIYETILPTLGLIFIQPINETYRDMPKLSTKNVLEKVPVSCVCVLIPVLYCSYDNPFVRNVFHESFENNVLRVPCDYHDVNLMKLWLNNPDNPDFVFEKFKEILDDENLLNDVEKQKILQQNIDTLVEREMQYETFIPDGLENRVILIHSSQIIAKNAGQQSNTSLVGKVRLFHTMNHPTKYMFNLMANVILQKLNVSGEAVCCEIDYLEHTQMPSYKCMENYMETIQINGNKMDLWEFVKMFVDGYATLDRTVLQQHVDKHDVMKK